MTFDALYEDVRVHVTLQSRLTKGGIKIGKRDPTDLKNLPTEEYVGRLMRETRNSAHGLKQLLREKKSAYLLSTHSGDIPPQLTHLATLISFALVADAEQLCAGTWW